MSTNNPEERTEPEDNLTRAESGDRDRLEAIAQHGLGTYVQVGNALAEIRDRHLYRDTHPSFETYIRERWAGNIPNTALPSHATAGTDAQALPTADPELQTARPPKPCEALARACEETLSALARNEQMNIEIRLAVRHQEAPGVDTEEATLDPSEIDDPVGPELLRRLRWLLTEATGTIGLVGYQLETRAADIDDGARAQLRDDVLVLDDELATVKALLLEIIDWDSELGRLLKDDLPPFDTDVDNHDADDEATGDD